MQKEWKVNMKNEINTVIVKRLKRYKKEAWRDYFNKKMFKEVFGSAAPKITKAQLDFIINDLIYTLENE